MRIECSNNIERLADMIPDLCDSEGFASNCKLLEGRMSCDHGLSNFGTVHDWICCQNSFDYLDTN